MQLVLLAFYCYLLVFGSVFDFDLELEGNEES